MNFRRQRNLKLRAPRGRRAERGVALVITLILLAVITTLAIAFLAITHRETGAVDSMARTTDAELAADSSLERAKAQIIASFPIRNANVADTGPDILGPDMMVSVCCQNIGGVQIHRPSLEVRENPTNSFDATPPVFVNTNVPGQPPGLDDRFFVDLNRNGYFEESREATNTINGTFPFQIEENPPGTPVINWRIGDPQWIGVLQDPRRLHDADNRFIGRYAFMVLPAGRTLDVNWIHNDVKGLAGPNPPAAPALGTSGYFRNQGAGCYEINLAAFLCDLNFNIWNNPQAPYGAVPYNYAVYYEYLEKTFLPDPITLSRGTAFDDAWQLLRFRCGGDRRNFNSINELFFPSSPQDIQTAIGGDFIDNYADGLPSKLSVQAGDGDNSGNRWPGSDSKRHFYSPHDFFDRTKLGTKPVNGRDFVERLLDASKLGNSQDRYTFYRMLAQLGTDSTAEQFNADEGGKININYVNVAGFDVRELVSWTDDPEIRRRTGRSGAELFFVTAAKRLLEDEFDLVTPAGKAVWIPVFTNGSRFSTNGPLYSGRVHQLLQLAANIYDATSGPKTSTDRDGPFYPTVFRPQFEVAGNDVFITNYVVVNGASEVIPPNVANPASGWIDLDIGQKPTTTTKGIYDIPLIVGARRGYPNFNEFAMQTSAQAVRRMEVHRAPNTTNTTELRQTFSLNVTNELAFEAWNSYANTYPRPLTIYFRNDSISVLTNSSTRFTPVVLGTPTNVQAVITNVWAGKTFHAPTPIRQTVINWETNTPIELGGTTNQWGLTVTNRILFFLVDGSDPANGRIVDAVTMTAVNGLFDIGVELAKVPAIGNTEHVKGIWSGAAVAGEGALPANVSYGVKQQWEISTIDADIVSTPQDWQDYGTYAKNRTDGITGFLEKLRNPTNQIVPLPFAPTRRMLRTHTWQVNDPLVHFTLDDLWSDGVQKTVRSFGGLQIGTENIGRYHPWPKAAVFSSPGSPDADPALRDPSILSSDRWDFPTNKFANVGWLGRVHRGTPWQTIYLKSRSSSDDNWRDHSGALRPLLVRRWMMPTNDWRLLDLFTTAIHPNATRGRLSINQTNVAAWSAVLSGIVTSTVTNDTSIDPASGTGLPIVPFDEVVPPNAASTDTPVETIVAGINKNRNARKNKQFNRLGDVLAVPELTDNSPFLRRQLAIDGSFDSLQPPDRMMVRDEDYERIPQQILSLLKVGEPRFVVYSWGQSLKPARLGIQRKADGTVDLAGLNGPSIDPATKICNNYQVTGEMATRAVIRVEFERDSTGQIDYRRPHAVVEAFNIIPVE